jgi:hypothetical protein
MNREPHALQEKISDRYTVDISSENSALLPPETTPGYSQAEQFRNIKHALEEVLGPQQDVTRLTVAILRQQQERRARPSPYPEQTLATTTNNKE